MTTAPGSMLKNASWNLIISAYRAAIGLLSAFLAVRILGTSDYGNVATLVSLFALYVTFSAGVFVVLVAKLMAPGNTSERALLFVAVNILSLFFIAVIVGLAVLLSGAAAGLRGSGMFNRDFWDVVRYGSLPLAFLASMQILSGLNAAIIESAGRLDLAVKSQALGVTVVFCALLTLFFLHESVDVGLYLGILCLGATIDAMILYVSRRSLALPRAPIKRISEAITLIPWLLKSGSVIQLSAVMNVFLEPYNKLLLAHFASAEAVTSYDLAMKLIWGLQGLFSAAMRIFLHISHRGADLIAGTYIRVVDILAVPALLTHAFGGLLLGFAVHWWMHVDPISIMIFYGIATISNLSMIYVMPLYISLIGQDDRRFLFVNQACLTISNVVASLTLIPLLGLVGAAVGLCFATLFNSFAIFARFRRKIGPIEGGRSLLSRRPLSLCLAIFLLLLSVVCTIMAEPSMILSGALVIGMGLLICLDPSVGTIFRRLTSKAEI